MLPCQGTFVEARAASGLQKAQNTHAVAAAVAAVVVPTAAAATTAAAAAEALAPGGTLQRQHSKTVNDQ